MTDHPRLAIWRGKRVRVLYYLGSGRFRILDSRDSQWSVSRSALIFLSES